MSDSTKDLAAASEPRGVVPELNGSRISVATKES